MHMFSLAKSSNIYPVTCIITNVELKHIIVPNRCRDNPELQVVVTPHCSCQGHGFSHHWAASQPGGREVPSAIYGVGVGASAMPVPSMG